MHVRQHDGSVAAVVSWCRVLLLVAGVVLLVDNDEAQVAVRQEHTRAHANYHARLARGEQLLPDIYPLVVAELAVIDEQSLAKDPPQALRQLSGKGNLGHEV